MRLGRIKIVIDCVVDLADRDMVEQGEDAIIDDVYSMVKYGEMRHHIEEEEDKDLTEADIPEFLTDTDE
jgi:hypothetical protein